MIIRRERFRAMASDETMEGYGSDEDSLAFSQLHTPLTQNPSKSPLDVSYILKNHLSRRFSIYLVHCAFCISARPCILHYCVKHSVEHFLALCLTQLHNKVLTFTSLTECHFRKNT